MLKGLTKVKAVLFKYRSHWYHVNCCQIEIIFYSIDYLPDQGCLERGSDVTFWFISQHCNLRHYYVQMQPQWRQCGVMQGRS